MTKNADAAFFMKTYLYYRIVYRIFGLVAVYRRYRYRKYRLRMSETRIHKATGRFFILPYRFKVFFFFFESFMTGFLSYRLFIIFVIFYYGIVHINRESLHIFIFLKLNIFKKYHIFFYLSDNFVMIKILILIMLSILCNSIQYF